VGRYTFLNLPSPATYTVTFAKAGFVGQTRLADLDPLAGQNDVSGVDASLIRSTATIGGVVHSAAGTPIPGATLVLTDGTVTRRLLTAHDPPGRFEFSPVDPGAYTLSASLPGTAPSILLVNVVAAEVRDNVNITLNAQASLTGRVLLLDRTTGVFNPYVGATVRLFPAENFPDGEALVVVATDLDGRYTFAGLDAPDDFVVAVYAAATASDALDSELVATQPSEAVTVPDFRLRRAS
jgi:hypothetical protein